MTDISEDSSKDDNEESKPKVINKMGSQITTALLNKFAKTTV